MLGLIGVPYSPPRCRGGTNECRGCLKSLEAGCRTDLETTAKKQCFGPFRLPYASQIHARSVARTSFWTISNVDLCKVRLIRPLGSS